MSVAAIQGGNFPTSLDTSQASKSQPPVSVSQARDLPTAETNASTLTASPQNSSTTVVESEEAPRLTVFQTYVHDLQSGDLAGALEALGELREELQSDGVQLSLSTSANQNHVSNSAAEASSSGTGPSGDRSTPPGGSKIDTTA